MQRTIDNASPQIKYYPAWDTSPDPVVTPEQATHNYFRGTLHRSSRPGDRAVLSFQASSIQVIGTRGYSHGNYTVQIDRETPQMFSGQMREREFRSQLYARRELSSGTHTITITNVPVPREDTQGARLDLDMIILHDEPTETFMSFMDDTHPAITYSSDWTSELQAGEWYRNDTAHYTSTRGASFTIPFSGTFIQLYGVLDSTYGNYTVTLDGRSEEMFTANWREYLHDASLYTVAGLDQGEHSITVRAVSTTAGSRIVFDYAIVNSTVYVPGSEPVGPASMPSGSPVRGDDVRPSSGSPSAPFSSSSLNGSASGSGSSVPIGAIVGSVAGGLVLILCLAIGFWLCRCRRRNTSHRRSSGSTLAPQAVIRSKRISIDGAPTSLDAESPLPIKEPEESIYSSGSHVSEMSNAQRDRLLSAILANPDIMRGGTMASSAALPESHYAPSIAASSQAMPWERATTVSKAPSKSPSVAPPTPVTPDTPKTRNLRQLTIPGPSGSDPSPAFIREHKIPTIIETERPDMDTVPPNYEFALAESQAGSPAPPRRA